MKSSIAGITSSRETSTEGVKRNPYIGKWNILFDRATNQWISFKPQEGINVYPCYACRDMFGSKSSFLDHVNRRGILLTYNCCCSLDRPLVFYNPCALLLHARQHYGSTGGCINLDNLSVASLPLGLAGFLPHPDVTMIYNVEDDNVEDNNINTKFYTPLQQDMGQQIVNLSPIMLLFYHTATSNNPAVTLMLKQISSNIPRCKFIILRNNIFTTADKRQSTPSNNNKSNDNNNKITCDELCIKQEPPDPSNNVSLVYNSIVIPKIEIEDIEDCNDMEDVETNVKGMTRAESSFNRCPECKNVQTTSMSIHFTNNSNKPFNESLRCVVCKYIAPSKCSLQAHQRIHEGIAPYVCPECGKDFSDCESLLDHLDDVCFHLAKQVRFRCPKKNCCKVFAQTATFYAHFAIHIQTLTRCRICSLFFCVLKDYLEHAKLQHSNAVATELIYRCTVCKNCVPFSEDVYQSHIKWHCSNRAQCIYVYVCKYCRNFFRSTLTYATHLLRCSKKAASFDEPRKIKRSNTATICSKCNYIIRIITTIANCPKCGEPFNTPYTVRQNAETKVVPDASAESYSIKPSQKMNCCVLCQTSLSLEEYLHHITKRKCKYHNPVVVLNCKSIGGTSASTFKESYCPRSDESSKKKRKKQLASPQSVKNKKLHCTNSETNLSQLDEPTPFDGTYRCRLCEYANENRRDFHDHVVVHRDISTAYQCMECGECFVVKPSLQKHLLYYHQIWEFEKYIEGNNCFDKNAVSELQENMKLAPGESKEPVAENQCRVCLLQFQDSQELNKHFRIHGMAFLLKNTK